jgi:hypothetical protein
VEAYLGEHLADADPPVVTAVPVDAAELERRAGIYRSRRTGAPLRMAMRDGKLRTGGGTELIPVGPGVFSFGPSGTRVEFVDGPPAVIRIVYPDADTVMYEPAAPADTTAASLAAYAGEYYGQEAEAAYTVAVVDGAVVLRMRPGTTIRLMPAYADVFSGPGGALVRFIRGADGRVEAFTISVERVRGLRFDRVAR